MGTRVSYPLEVKMKAIEIRLARVPVKEVMEEFNMQLKTWMRWYRNGELHLLKHPDVKEERNQEIVDLRQINKFRYGYRKIAQLYAQTCEKALQRVMQKYGWERYRVKVKKPK